MIRDHFIKILSGTFGYEPTTGQQELIHLLTDFILRKDNHEVFLITGYAGTGKTTLVASLVKTLTRFSIRSILLAPTGRAAKVLSSYAQQNSSTIHKKIYRQKTSVDGFGEFVLDFNYHSQTVFIIDEASMISNSSNEMNIFGSGRLLDDLIRYVYNGKNCKMILMGDTAQLPPVGIEVSPALDRNVLGYYNLSVTGSCLTEVVRQEQDSGILRNATSIRKQISHLQDLVTLPRFKIDGCTDIVRIGGSEVIEELSSAYDQYGMEETIVVTRSNKTANQYNTAIRNRILWREDLLSSGDYLMVVKNNYFWMDATENVDFIANGDIAKVIRIHRFEERYGFRFAEVTLQWIDFENREARAKIILDTLTIDTASFSSEENKKFFHAVMEDHASVNPMKKRYEAVKKDPYFNALQVKFSYAVTCHKAQGGQWKSAFIDQGYMTESRLNVEYLRWLYTAFTRSSKKLYLVNFSDRYFE